MKSIYGVGFMNILIVEDNREILEDIAESLKNDGFVVDASEDGAEGWRKLQSQHYDAVLLDIGLPNKDGKSICTDLRASGNITPVIILSSESEVDSKVMLLNCGADDYVTKPFRYEELLARLRAVLRRPQAIQGEIVSINNLVLDMRSRTVERAGELIHLTPKEFALLEYLIRHKGVVLSRQTLLEHVWDVNADPFTNTVEAHIRNIRRKIDIEGEESFIQTVSGIGYKID